MSKAYYMLAAAVAAACVIIPLVLSVTFGYDRPELIMTEITNARFSIGCPPANGISELPIGQTICTSPTYITLTEDEQKTTVPTLDTLLGEEEAQKYQQPITAWTFYAGPVTSDAEMLSVNISPLLYSPSTKGSVLFYVEAIKGVVPNGKPLTLSHATFNPKTSTTSHVLMKFECPTKETSTNVTRCSSQSVYALPVEATYAFVKLTIGVYSTDGVPSIFPVSEGMRSVEDYYADSLGKGIHPSSGNVLGNSDIFEISVSQSTPGVKDTLNIIRFSCLIFICFCALVCGILTYIEEYEDPVIGTRYVESHHATLINIMMWSAAIYCCPIVHMDPVITGLGTSLSRVESIMESFGECLVLACALQIVGLDSMIIKKTVPSLLPGLQGTGAERFQLMSLKPVKFLYRIMPFMVFGASLVLPILLLTAKISGTPRSISQISFGSLTIPKSPFTISVQVVSILLFVSSVVFLLVLIIVNKASVFSLNKYLNSGNGSPVFGAGASPQSGVNGKGNPLWEQDKADESESGDGNGNGQLVEGVKVQRGLKTGGAQMNNILNDSEFPNQVQVQKRISVADNTTSVPFLFSNWSIALDIILALVVVYIVIGGSTSVSYTPQSANLSVCSYIELFGIVVCTCAYSILDVLTWSRAGYMLTYMSL